MNFDPYNLTLFLDCISICLSAFLMFNSFAFRGRRFDAITYQTIIVFLGSILEIFAIAARLHHWIEPDNIMIMEFFAVFLYATVNVSIMTQVYDNMDFLPRISQKKQRLLFSLLLFVPFMTARFQTLGSYGRILTGEGFDLYAATDVLYVAYLHLCFIQIWYSIAVIVLAWAKKKRVGIEYAYGCLALTVFSLIIRQLQSYCFRDIGVKYESNAILFALCYNFFYCMINARILLKSKEKEFQMQADLKLATKIQIDQLPKPDPEFPLEEGIDLQASMYTAKEVGGDFYDYFKLEDGRMVFLIADVSGKGVPAALFMMNAKNIIEIVAQSFDQVTDIMNKCNQLLSRNNEAMMFVTLWMGIYDKQLNELTYTNAGHNPPIFVPKNGKKRFLDEVHGYVMGINEDGAYQMSRLQVEEGDRLFLYTDGLTETHDKERQLFGEDRVMELLEAYKAQSGRTLMNEMYKKTTEFSQGLTPFDDITMMTVDFHIDQAERTNEFDDFLDSL